ncbi:histidine kinase [Leptospira stimsonii]|uniref:histidine kinase n=1 Tax=Leptospira stimsonii TaxID=2202203 RepID=A0ABY2N029_9LEPT|nr:ATP-binding protein [Leptospira stimsonii]TGK25181.1 histidine kinase [Leptospira stimsonii]TGM13118.1 histidine kinase [Leptospira stimsonii]
MNLIARANGWIVNTIILTEGNAFLTESVFSILSQLRTPLGILDKNFQVMFCNDSFTTLCGESERELCKGKSLDQIIKIRNRSQIEEFRNLNIGNSIEFQGRTRTDFGKETEFKAVLNRVRIDSSECFLLEILEYFEEGFFRNKEKELSAVISKVYHDLQEPIRNLTSFLKLLSKRSSEELSQDGKEFLQISLAGADRLWNRINSLLSFVRIEKEGKRFRKISLRETLEASLLDLEKDIEASDLTLEWIGEFPEIQGSAPLLQELFFNLFQNSIHFRKPNKPGRILISYQEFPKVHRIRVQDDGIGVELNGEPYRIELFHRYPNAQSVKGMGCGLFFSKKIAELHGGSLEVESSPSGFSVTIDLPIEPVSESL